MGSTAQSASPAPLTRGARIHQSHLAFTLFDILWKALSANGGLTTVIISKQHCLLALLTPVFCLAYHASPVFLHKLFLRRFVVVPYDDDVVSRSKGFTNGEYQQQPAQSSTFWDSPSSLSAWLLPCVDSHLPSVLAKRRCDC